MKLSWDREKERTCLLGSAIFCSDFKQKMEAELLKLLRQTKEAGGSASLSIFTTKDGKLKAKLEVELDPPAPTSPGSTSPLPATAPAPVGGRRRRKGAAAKAKAKARATLHRAAQAAATSSPPASGDASATLDPPLRRPPRLLLSPSPTSGRRRVMSLGRLPMPSLLILSWAFIIKINKKNIIFDGKCIQLIPNISNTLLDIGGCPFDW